MGPLGIGVTGYCDIIGLCAYQRGPKIELTLRLSMTPPPAPKTPNSASSEPGAGHR